MIFGGFPISNYNPEDTNVHDPFTEQFLQEKIDLTNQHIENLSILDDTQDRFNVLRIGIIPGFTYLYPFIHMGENAKFRKYAILHEDSIQRGLSNIINAPFLTPDRWAISKLPISMAGLGLSCGTQPADISYWCNSNQNTDSQPTDPRTALSLKNLQKSPEMSQLIHKIQNGSSKHQLQRRITYIAYENNLEAILTPLDSHQQRKIQDNCQDTSTLSDLGTSHKGNIPNPIFLAIVRDRIQLPISVLDHKCNENTKCTVCGQHLDNEGIHAATCGRSNTYIKDHDTVVNALYECAKSAAPQSANQLTGVNWDPKGLVNGDNSRPADIHCKINQKDHAFDVTILHNRTSTHRNIYENTDRAIKAKEQDKKEKYNHIPSTSSITFIPFVVDEHGRFGECAHSIIELIARQLNQSYIQKTCFRKYWEKRIRSALRTGIMKHRLDRQNRCSPFHSALCNLRNSQMTNQHLSFSASIQSTFPINLTSSGLESAMQLGSVP